MLRTLTNAYAGFHTPREPYQPQHYPVPQRRSRIRSTMTRLDPWLIYPPPPPLPHHGRDLLRSSSHQNALSDPPSTSIVRLPSTTLPRPLVPRVPVPPPSPWTVSNIGSLSQLCLSLFLCLFLSLSLSVKRPHDFSVVARIMASGLHGCIIK